MNIDKRKNSGSSNSSNNNSKNDMVDIDAENIEDKTFFETKNNQKVQ